MRAMPIKDKDTGHAIEPGCLFGVSACLWYNFQRSVPAMLALILSLSTPLATKRMLLFALHPRMPTHQVCRALIPLLQPRHIR